MEVVYGQVRSMSAIVEKSQVVNKLTQTLEVMHGRIRLPRPDRGQ